MEIERKYLVREPPADLARHPSREILQGYLAAGEGESPVEVRVRRRGDEASLTIKSGSGRARLEEEIAIEPARFERLWPLTRGRRVAKRRYEVEIGSGLTLELDVYTGDLAGLMTAEVEFPSEACADAFQPPAWLGEEVTDDARFKNRRLATDGIPQR